MSASPGARHHIRTMGWGLILAWVLTVGGAYASRWVSAAAFDTEAEPLTPAPYLFAAAIGVVGLVAVRAKRHTQTDGIDRVGFQVRRTSQALALGTAGVGGIAVLSRVISLVETSHVPFSVRVVNGYVPIVLYTGLVVAIVLAAFVFSPAPEPTDSRAVLDDPQGSQDSTAARALAYALPLGCFAVGIIAAGVMYDLTATSLTSWLFVVAFITTGIGVVLGARFASLHTRSRGASGFSLATVIVFCVVGLAGAFISGATSTDHLARYTNLSLEVTTKDLTSPTAALPPGELMVIVNGEGLAPSPLTCCSRPGIFRWETYNLTATGGCMARSISPPLNSARAA
ncbi:MAG TPA: hypothetical protein VK054_12155 [Beutenbergiaceae bacterium]|nr:hypothetical protein [Beutenbergiaceae bacterium]